MGIKNLLMHKLRSFLTILGIVFGVGSVIAMLSVGEGANRDALDQIRKLGSRNIILTSIKPIEEGVITTRPAYQNIYGLLYEDEQRIRDTMPSILQTVPVKLFRKDAFFGERVLELRVVGTTPDWFDLIKRPILAGRVISQKDLDNYARVCVLTEYAARRLLATEHTIGQTVRIGSGHFKVVGIVQSEQGRDDAQTPDQEIDAYVPISTARELYGDAFWRRTAGGRYSERVELQQLLVHIKSTEKVEQTAAAIEAMLRRFHKKKDYNISVPLGLLRQAEETKRRFNIVLGSIAAISLLVGGIGIMNIMLASVMERTREIGIRRAIGAKRKQIIGQFLIETVVLSTVGGVIGICIGIFLPWLITKFSGMPTIVPIYGIILSFVLSIGVGVIFGVYPAFRAAMFDPIAALRHE
ncbi:ABC transporter permease [bacterium]|nr:ABC transporter permease [bacterium]